MGDEGGCYLVNGSVLTDSCSLLEEVRAKVFCKSGKEPVILRCSASHRIQGETILGFFLKLYRKHGLQRNERVTVMSRDDQLIALQLVMAEKHKQTDGEFDVDTEDVLRADKQVTTLKLSHDRESQTESLEASHIYNLYQEFLVRGNYIDWADIVTECSREAINSEHLAKDIQQNSYIVILDKDLRKEELNLLELLCKDHRCCAVEVATTPQSLDESFTSEVCFTPTSLADVTAEVCTKDQSGGSEFTSPQKSATESFVWSTVLSYLELLVNSRSELSLARIINTPNRGLDHTAFTDIKRHARSLNMPIYQATMSYITKVRLGGKGYAPKACCPLAQHVKGIGEFSDLMQKIQTTLEEDFNTSSACRRIVNSLKIALLKDKDCRLRRSSIENAVQSIQTYLSEIIASKDQAMINTPDRPAGRGGSMAGRQTVKVIRSLLDREATRATTCHSTNVLGDLFSSQKTPVHFPSILSKFRSPAEAEENEKWDATLAQRVHQNQLRVKSAAKLQGRTVSNKSDFDWAVPLYSRSDSDANLFLTSSPVVVMPSKTLVQPGTNTIVSLSTSVNVLESANDQENLERDSSNKDKIVKQKGTLTNVNNKVRKYSDIDDDKEQSVASSQPPVKKQKIQSAKTKKAVRRKLIPQIKGQQSLTKFFRV